MHYLVFHAGNKGFQASQQRLYLLLRRTTTSVSVVLVIEGFVGSFQPRYTPLLFPSDPQFCENSPPVATIDTTILTFLPRIYSTFLLYVSSSSCVLLLLEHQMAEESIDSGVSSENSQHTLLWCQRHTTEPLDKDACPEHNRVVCDSKLVPSQENEGYYAIPSRTSSQSDQSLGSRFFLHQRKSDKNLPDSLCPSLSHLDDPGPPSESASSRPRSSGGLPTQSKTLPESQTKQTSLPEDCNEMQGDPNAGNPRVHFATDHQYHPQQQQPQPHQTPYRQFPSSIFCDPLEQANILGPEGRLPMPACATYQHQHQQHSSRPLRYNSLQQPSQRDYLYLPPVQRMAASVPSLPLSAGSLGGGMVSPTQPLDSRLPNGGQTQHGLARRATIATGHTSSGQTRLGSTIQSLLRDLTASISDSDSGLTPGTSLREQQFLSKLLASASRSSQTTIIASSSSPSYPLVQQQQQQFPGRRVLVSGARHSDPDLPAVAYGDDGMRRKPCATASISQSQKQAAAAAAAVAAAAVAYAAMQGGQSRTAPPQQEAPVEPSQATANFPASRRPSEPGLDVMLALAGRGRAVSSADDCANYQSLEALLCQTQLQGQRMVGPPPAPSVRPEEAHRLPTRGSLPEEIYVGLSQLPNPTYGSMGMQNHDPRASGIRLGNPPETMMSPTAHSHSSRFGPPEEAPGDRFMDFVPLPSEPWPNVGHPQPILTPGPWSTSGLTARTPSRTVWPHTGLQSAAPSQQRQEPAQKPCQPQLQLRIPMQQVNGLLMLHLVAGNGLHSTQTTLRDLYCVIEMDALRKARSMIRTSNTFFDWNEVFELDLEDSRFLAFLLYQWDPRTKHRLCFYGGIDLRSLVNRLLTNQVTYPLPAAEAAGASYSADYATIGHEKASTSGSLATRGPARRGVISPALLHLPYYCDRLALQLEPRGILYLEVGYYTLGCIYHRYQAILEITPPTPSFASGALFGVHIDELIEREQVIQQLVTGGRQDYPSRVGARIVTSDGSSMHVPLFIRKCVEEIDRRGTEVVGIYRLASSVWMKLQVREIFNRSTKAILRSMFRRDTRTIESISNSIDISPERVPDVHAITALFKDFLREMPEPLFTSALYPMFYDAMQVTLPGVSQSGAKLMLNILDCLPTNNQEILLYLLDHFKRVTNNSEINKMDTESLATCLAPALFYPTPSAAQNMDINILEPQKMIEIFKFILDIWPEERVGGSGDEVVGAGAGSEDQMPGDLLFWSTGGRASQPGFDVELFAGRKYDTRSGKLRSDCPRSGSSARSTMSGPAALRSETRSPRIAGHRSTSVATTSNKAKSDRQNYAFLRGPKSRVAMGTRFADLPDNRSTRGDRDSGVVGHRLSCLRPSTPSITPDYAQQRGEPGASHHYQPYHYRSHHEHRRHGLSSEPVRRSQFRLQDNQPTAYSTGTDSGTHSSRSAGGVQEHLGPQTRDITLTSRITRPTKTSRSMSHDRHDYPNAKGYN